jgi:two-component system nitrogen regulation sensor histidine kinase GlnL
MTSIPQGPLSHPSFSGLDLLTVAVAVLDSGLRVVYLNPAGETVLALSLRNAKGHAFADYFVDGKSFGQRLSQALVDTRGFADQELTLTRPGYEPLHLNCVVTPVESGSAALLLEFRPIEHQLRLEREMQLMTQQEANRELIRNLAHEIRNPLGGIRGSAQLLESELDRPDLREYTQVIINESDRLQVLMDRLLTPHRRPQFGTVSIHEVCDRVRMLILAEFIEGIQVVRDYDTSLPELHGDREQLIQAVLNVVRNAAQAMKGKGQIVLRTRIARQVTLAKTRHKLALELQVMDNGPGIPAAIRDRIFYPLVSGREGGSGLGLTLAQTFVQHHHGVIEVESEPGRTCFRIILPLQ